MGDRYFQTTPIYYVNDRPHLGTAYSMIVSDALSRWHRLLGDEVFFLTGTDEHGLKLARTAAEAGKSPQDWVDASSVWFERAWASLEISNDDFIRTTEPRHLASVAQFVQTIYDNGYIYKGEYSGWYCVSCENYYAESDLLDGARCPIHERPVEWVTEENYFFALSRLTDELLAFYAEHPRAVVPESRRNEALGLIRQGLEDFSISRTSFDWGIPVPWDPDHVFYVWFEALMNYTSAVGYGVDEERFRTWWPVVHHLIGKDIVKFHCVWWPAMCIAAGIEPPGTVIAHGYLLVGGKKMSKSQTNHVDPVELAEEVGLDPLRYHLLRDVTLGLDGEFTYESLVARYNADLANNLGNLLQRVSTLVVSKCGGKGPAPSGETALRGAVGERRRRGAALLGGATGRTRRCRRRGRSSAPPTPRSRPPSPGSSIPARRSTPSSATRSRRCASSRSSPRRRYPAPRRRSGAASACRERPTSPGPRLSVPASNGAATRAD